MQKIAELLLLPNLLTISVIRLNRFTALNTQYSNLMMNLSNFSYLQINLNLKWHKKFLIYQSKMIFFPKISMFWLLESRAYPNFLNNWKKPSFQRYGLNKITLLRLRRLPLNSKFIGSTKILKIQLHLESILPSGISYFQPPLGKLPI